jgi:hypothetical protein
MSTNPVILIEIFGYDIREYGWERRWDSTQIQFYEFMNTLRTPKIVSNIL